MDLDTQTPGVQSTRNVPSGTILEIAVVASDVADPYAGYQWALEWDDATLDYLSNAENTSNHGATLCAPVRVVHTETGQERVGEGAGCLRSSGTTTFAGVLTTVTIRCQTDGLTDVHLVQESEGSAFWTTLLGAGGTLLTTVHNDAALQCGTLPEGLGPEPPTPTLINSPTTTPSVTATPEPTALFW